MKKFEIWFGKDLEKLLDWYWSDKAEDTEEFREAQVAGIYATDDEEAFWAMMVAINIAPPAMWYWVIIDGETCMSGAIDPDDLESMDAPEWVFEIRDRIL